MNPTIISKSQFIRGKKCKKSLWLYRNKSDERTPPSQKRQEIFDNGNLVGELAQKMFPDGVLVAEDYTKIAEAIETTRAFVREGKKFVFESTASNKEGFFSRIDVLEKNEDGSFNLIEVKSTESIRDYYLDDLALQAWAFIGEGYEIKKTILMYLKKGTYKTISENSVPEQIFQFEDVTEKVFERIDDVKKTGAELLDVLTQGEPFVKIGNYCDSPYECDFKEYCKGTS